MDTISVDRGDFHLERSGISVTGKTLRNGRSRGVEIVEIKKDDSVFTFLPTRGGAVWQAVFDGTPLFWESPVPPVHPAFIHPLRNEGLGWLDGFCEGIARCGIEHFGNPAHETVTNNQGQAMEVFRPLHGEIGNIPAEEVGVDIHGPDRCIIKSKISFASVFGSKYAVASMIEIHFCSRSFTVTDKVENRSRERALPVRLCYHINFGRPLLDEDAELVVSPAGEVVPMSPCAEAGLKDYSRFGPPQKHFVEHCFLLNYTGDEQRKDLLLINREISRAALLSFSSGDFPCVVEWKQLGLDEYVLGLEPATCAPPSMGQESPMGTPPVLLPGAWRDFSFHIALLVEKDEIADAERRIKGT